MYSSYGNCAGCQERSWNQVPRMISSPAIRIFFFFFMYTPMKIPFMYSFSGNCVHDLPALQSVVVFSLIYTATKIPLMYSSSGNFFPRMISQPCNQDLIFFNVHFNNNPIYDSSSGNCTLPGEVVEPGTGHDLQPCNQEFFFMYTATKIPFMYSSSGNCTGCQERSWNQVPCMISSPAIRNFFFFFFFKCTLQQKIPFLYSSSGNCAHDLQPCNQDLFFFFKCTLQNKFHLYIPVLGIARLISLPCNQDFIFFFNVHCDKNPIYVFLFGELRAWSPSPAIRIWFF